jgi:hypothetical protein
MDAAFVQVLSADADKSLSKKFDGLLLHHICKLYNLILTPPATSISG